MEIIVFGANHKVAGVETRERLACSAAELTEALDCLAGYKSIKESVILSTCNRVEVYVVAEDFDKGKRALMNFLEEYHKLSFEDVENKCYLHRLPGSLSHLFKVASSLDSMVIGETQILGQIKEAYAIAHKNGNTKSILNRTFQRAFRVAKKVRTHTSIAKGSISISSVAVELAANVLGRLAGKNVVVVGAGKMGELTAKNLLSEGVKSVIVANRSFDKAEELASKFNGTAIRFDRFVEEMAFSDIAIISSAAPHYVLNRKDVETIISMREGAPLFLIDISVPRNIDPKVRDVRNVHLYDIDDLREVSEKNLSRRRAQVEKALRIIEEECGKFRFTRMETDVSKISGDAKLSSVTG